jgi:ATP-dependent protease ClpP protease subunit
MNPSWLTVRNESSEAEAEIRVIGPIGKSFFDEEQMHEGAFRAALDSIPVGRKIRVFWNSEGGAVRDGLGIYNALKSRRPHVRSVITGYAMSAASFAPLGAETVETPEGAVWMLHKPWSGQEGNADDFRKAAEMLDAHERAMVDIYVEETGKTEAEVIDALRAETWLSGKEAVDWGLADKMNDGPVALASLEQSRYRRMPAALGSNTLPPTKGNRMQNENKTVAAGDEVQAAEYNRVKAQLEKVEGQLAKERKDRIERDLDQCVAEDRITIAQRSYWLPKCLADETLLEGVKAIEPKPQTKATKPAVTGVGTVDDEYRKMEAGAARSAFRKPRFDAIMDARRNANVQAANTISADLLPDTIADALIVALTTRLASFNALSRNFGTDPMRPLSVVQVRKATSGSTLQTNATNWESGNSVIDAIPVTVAQKSKSFHITNAELNSGHQLTNLTEVNANEFAVSLSELATAVMLVADYGAGTVIGTAANFDSADLPAILALAKNYRSRNLILDGGHLARLQALNTESLDWRTAGAFGFDVIAMQNTWTGATANTVGFVCDPDAIAIATGMPVTAAAAGGDIQQSMVQLPDNGLAVQVNTWFSRATRTTWVSYDIMIGVAKGDVAKAEILLSA